jgi:membrane protease YdiL (CAAX protease family)
LDLTPGSFIQPPAPRRDPIFYNAKGIRSGWRLLVWFALSAALLVAFVIFLAVAIAIWLTLSGGSTQHFNPHALPEWMELDSELLVLPVVLVPAIFVALVMERRPISSLGLGFYRGWLRQTLQGLGIGLLMIVAVMTILMAFGAYRVEGLNGGLGFAVLSGSQMAVGFLGVGLFEEFAHRGYLLQNLIDGLGLPAAAIITCILFAALHISNTGENRLGILDVLVAGIQLLVLVMRTRSLWMAVGLHAAWDWGMSFLFGVANSGNVLTGALLRTTVHGPVWLSGGSAGPEGSVVTIVVDCLATLYFARAAWIRPTPEAAALWTRYVSPREEPAPPSPARNEVQVAPHAAA